MRSRSAVTSWWFGEVVILCLSAGVLAVAALLTPSAEALSFFGADVPILCNFRRLTGYGCPGCGLTRSFAFLAHGQPLLGFSMNPLGPALFVLVASQVPYRVLRLFRGWRTHVAVSDGVGRG